MVLMPPVVCGAALLLLLIPEQTTIGLLGRLLMLPLFMAGALSLMAGLIGLLDAFVCLLTEEGRHRALRVLLRRRGARGDIVTAGDMKSKSLPRETDLW